MEQRSASIEDIILRYSRRGMPVLRQYFSGSPCRMAAEEILGWKRGTVLLTTGFYVAGFAETDGPPGTLALSRALKKLGFCPVIVTDRFCEGFFEPEGIRTEYLALDAEDSAAHEIIERYSPAGLISVERCGRDRNGIYANMRGISITENTAPCDALFLSAYGRIPTIGVGDGGNEIGMGNLADVVRTRLSLVPAEVKSDILVIATVSNWGAYGIVAALEALTRMPLLLSYEEAEAFLLRIVAMGSVDGISHEHTATADGFGPENEKEILGDLHRTAASSVPVNDTE